MLLIGPARVRSLPGWVERLQTWGSARQPSKIIGHETLLGRRTAVIEYGSTSTFDRGDGRIGLTGLNRMWVDVRTLQILRHETDNGRFIIEVTLFDESPMPAEIFRFTPPPGELIVDAPAPEPFAGPPRDPPPGTYPPGSLIPSYVPAGFEPLGGSGHRNSPADWQLTQSFGPRKEPVVIVGDGAPITIAEHPLSSGPASPGAGTVTDVNGHDAILVVDGPRITLSWAQDGVAIVLIARDLPLAEVMAVAASLRAAP
jgi:hypothetical protein